MASNSLKEEVNINKMYGENATLTKEDFIKKHNINTNGLSTKEAENRINNLRS